MYSEKIKPVRTRNVFLKYCTFFYNFHNSLILQDYFYLFLTKFKFKKNKIRFVLLFQAIVRVIHNYFNFKSIIYDES